LHICKLFDDRINAVTETGASQIFVKNFHLGLLALLRLTTCRNFDQRLAECSRERDGEAGFGHPDTVDEVETCDVLGQGARHDQRNLGFGITLVIAHFR